MAEDNRFQPGRTVLLRGIQQGRVRYAQPRIVIQDEPDMVVLYTRTGFWWKMPVALDGSRSGPATILTGNWVLKDNQWQNLNRLTMKNPLSSYSAEIFYNAADNSVRCWYINMEEPFQRTTLGFDCLDLMLDIVAAPDLSTWRWKDEDELEEAARFGVISSAKADELRHEGEKAIHWLQSGKSPFNEWIRWTPDPLCPIPVLPEGWDIIEESG